jgi:uncharacterized protein (TIGR00730 family)
MLAERKPVDVITVAEHMQTAGEHDDIGLHFLGELAANTPSASNIVRYAQVVLEKRMLRELVAAADAINVLANEGSDPALKQAVEELGRWIGESGNALVYGGSRSGLMGRLAHSVLTAGGEVTGVEPQFFIDSEVQYDGLTSLIVTQDMTERKTRMIELGDAFIAFPGGTGTLEEITEVMSRVSLGHLDAPCILYDLDGYYAGLKALLAHMVKMGLSSPERQSGIYFAKELDEIKSILKRA